MVSGPRDRHRVVPAALAEDLKSIMKDPTTERFPSWELLESWVTVVECRSISEAARQLGISQAGVSQRIKTIESLLDTLLLDRTTRPALPTAAGQRLFEHAASLLQGAGQMVESIRNITRDKRLVVRIGCVDSFAATIGPTIIRGLAGTSRQIRLWSGITPILDEQLNGRHLDFAVTTSEIAQAPGVMKRMIFTEPYYVVVPKDFARSSFTTLSDLGKRLQLIRYSGRSFIGRQVDAYLSGYAENIERSYEFDATDPMLSLVAAGLGFAITTPLCIWQSRHFVNDVSVVSLSAFSRSGRPYQHLSRSFYLSYRESELGSLPLELFDLLSQVCRTQISRDIATALNIAPEDVLQAAKA